jgi:YidC/Oxa1 family membrane protein insertase
MNAAQGAAATQNNSLKMMQTIFPLMILFWGTSLSAGLILYWTVGSIFQIGQQYYMKRPVKGENV